MLLPCQIVIPVLQNLVFTKYLILAKSGNNIEYQYIIVILYVNLSNK